MIGPLVTRRRLLDELARRNTWCADAIARNTELQRRLSDRAVRRRAATWLFGRAEAYQNGVKHVRTTKAGLCRDADACFRVGRELELLAEALINNLLED